MQERRVTPGSEPPGQASQGLEQPKGAAALRGRERPHVQSLRAPGRSGLSCCFLGPWNLPVVSRVTMAYLDTSEPPNLPV